MAVLIGSFHTVSTWGKFRCVWCLDNFAAFNKTAFTIEYLTGEGIKGQKSAAEGSGLIRWPRGIAQFIDQQPTIGIVPVGDDGNVLYIAPFITVPVPWANSAATEEIKNELIGQTVVHNGGSSVISSDLFDDGQQNVGGANIDYSPIISVGKLMPF